MTRPDAAEDARWAARVTIWMCNVWLHDPDPISRFDEWLDEAAEEDERYIREAKVVWAQLQNKNAHDLEDVRAGAQWYLDSAKFLPAF